MKFLKKINRNYIFALAVMLIVISIAGYFAIQKIIQVETEESLLEREQLIKDQLLETGQASTLFPIIEIEIIHKKTLPEPIFKKIFLEDEVEDELEPFIEYSNEFEVKGVLYSVKLRQSVFESEDLIFILGLTLFLLVLLSFVISYLIAKRMNKTIWHNFEQNLLKIENFSFKENSDLQLYDTNIDEFDRLNKVITSLTDKLKTDYLSLKEFTENASHEIQTPLSIILLNLEEILQQEFDEDTLKKVVTSINAAKRLSNLNQSLILLAKIENRQFPAEKKINLNAILEQKLIDYSSLLETKKLKVELNTEHNFEVKMNEQLADVLISNLLTNAINHNTSGGKIQILFKEKELKICNTGLENTLTNATIFNRFEKGNSKSTGLGLAIVKKICDAYNMKINYSKNGIHCFTISPKS